MHRPLYSLCWFNGLVYWLLLSTSGWILSRSPRGFKSEAEAETDFDRWNT